MTTASCHARLRLRASERESQINAIPKASATMRAAVGTPGGRTPCTIWYRSANSGVSDDATPMQPTRAAAPAEERLGPGHPTPHGVRVTSLPNGGPGAEPHSAAALGGTLLALTAAGLLPWTLWLTFTLPSRHVTEHYDVAWVVFDCALFCAFAATAWCAVEGLAMARAASQP